MHHRQPAKPPASGSDDGTLCAGSSEHMKLQESPGSPPVPATDFAALQRAKSNELPATEGMIAFSSNMSRTKTVETEKGIVTVELDEEEDFPDGGRGWLVVAAAWIYAASSISYGMSSGVLIEELHRNVHPDVPLGTLSLVFGLNNFVGNFMAFFAGRLGDVYGYRPVMAAGGVVWTMAMALSAVAYKSLVGLFLVNGLLAGVGIGLGFPLYFALCSMWFKKKRGLATGIAVGGSGMGAAFLAVVLRIMLPRIGYQNTMLVWAGMIALCQSIAFAGAKIRLAPLKPGESRVSRNWLPDGVWRDSAWYSLLASVGVGIFGYLVPFFFLITYTQELEPDMTGLKVALPLVLSNVGSGIGRIIAGTVSDQVGPVNMLIFSFIVGGALQVGFWPNASSYGAVCAFGALYGFIASWAVSLLPVVVAQLFGMKGLATTTGFMVLCNAPGTFVGAPVAGYILEASGRSWAAVAAYGGGVMVFGGVALMYARFSREKRIWAKF